jgi:hypothetical protein
LHEQVNYVYSQLSKLLTVILSLRLNHHHHQQQQQQQQHGLASSKDLFPLQDLKL